MHDPSVTPQDPSAPESPADTKKQAARKKAPNRPPPTEPPAADGGPGGGNPPVGKKGPKRTRTAGSLDKLKKKVWQSISAAEEIVVDPDVDAATRLRGIHALVQASTAYARLIEFSEQSEHIGTLEEEVAALKKRTE